MQLYDPKVPPRLKATQEWFGKIISSPLVADSKISELTPSGGNIKEEAEARISPSPTLKPYERIQLYNQQYWWRLISNMQDTFPFIVRLFGYTDFNDTIATPYLIAYPPSHWSLDVLGSNLPKWISDSYHANDKQLVHDAALLDIFYLSLFFKPLLKVLSEDQFDSTIYLQPHVTFLEFPYEIVAFRDAMLEQEPDHWIDNPFPELKRVPQSLILYRSLKGHTTYKCLSSAEMTLLKLFQKGTTLDAVCEWIETQSSEFRSEVEQSLQKWFQDWTIRGILTHEIDQKGSR